RGVRILEIYPGPSTLFFMSFLSNGHLLSGRIKNHQKRPKTLIYYAPQPPNQQLSSTKTAPPEIPSPPVFSAFLFFFHDPSSKAAIGR
ncbi:hypothetical protein, partial [uncultured Alcanivorax sp.]|uniref:hypothetical protein n=1 Tax=uncultured Alcanivorax sp. TaxID=191215 RepID=UPI002590AFAF